MEDATRLRQIIEKKGRRYRATKNGFVFSNDQIRAAAWSPLDYFKQAF
jgi:hypothetical protein